VEAALAKLGQEAATLDAALQDPRLYAGNKADLIARATARRAAVARDTAALEAEWLELSERLEAEAPA
jgi:ATP-binding cassette subfamily F protein 3